MKWKKILTTVSVISLLSLLPITAIIQTAWAEPGIDGYNRQLFYTPSDGLGGFETPSADILRHKQFRIGVTPSFTGKSVLLNNPALARDVQLVNNAFTSEFTAAIGLFDRFSVGINLPLSVMTGTNNNNLSSYTSYGIGDIAFQPKGQLLKEKKYLPAVSLMSTVWVPTGNRNKFTGNKGATVEGQVIFEKSIEKFTAAANVGYRFIDKMVVRNTEVNDMIIYGGRVSYDLPKKFQIFSEVAGAQMVMDRGRGFDPVEINGGVKHRIGAHLEWMVGGGGSLQSSQSGLGKYRAFAGLSYNFGGKRSEPISRMVAVPITINFPFDSSHVKREYYPQLREVAQKVFFNDQFQLEIAGHTDSVGSKKYNASLSRRRAENVRQILIYSGAPEDRLKTNYYGEDQPIAPNCTANGRKQNRRVEINSRDVE